MSTRPAGNVLAVDWVARLGPTGPGSDPHVSEGAGIDLDLLDTPESSAPLIAANRSARVVFAGTLDNEEDIRLTAGSPLAARGPAALILEAWSTAGEPVIGRLRGAFALLVADSARGEVLAVRDHLGLFPLFWTEIGPGAALVSPSIDRLLAQPEVSRTLNRVALADHLSHRWPEKTETCFAAVRRIPPGHVLRLAAGTRTLGRYWLPGIRDGQIDWIGEHDLDRFDALLERSVARSIGDRPPGISLSGGLDSISVAVVAAALANRNGNSPPLALSLGFPEDSNEEPVQRAVAADLGLDHLFVPIHETGGPRGIVGSSLDLSATRPSPLLSPWCSAYAYLARQAGERGIRGILTGTGGDEWLTVSPYHAADMLRRGDVGGLLHLAVATRRSFNVSWAAVARTLLRFGLRPAASRAIDGLVPRFWRRNRQRRLLRTTPAWVAPAPALRREMDDRAARSLMNLRPEGGFYTEELRVSLDHPLVAWELEESFETGRESGIMYRHPYLDADLVDFLFRTPPHLLNRGGRSKGLVREAVSRRFPALGFDRQKKVTGTSFYRGLLLREAPREWQRLGGPRKLAELGVVDLDLLTRSAEKIFQESLPEVHHVWDVLSLEVWVRLRT